MSHKIYKDILTNTFFIEGVASGNVSEFTVERKGDYFSFWHNGFGRYEVKNIHYSTLTDKNHNHFTSADAFEDYLDNIFTIDNVEISYSKTIKGEIPNGILNGINASYFSQYPFIPENLEVYLNGLRLMNGVDYVTTGTNEIRLFISPQDGEIIQINYLTT